MASDDMLPSTPAPSPRRRKRTVTPRPPGCAASEGAPPAPPQTAALAAATVVVTDYERGREVGQHDARLRNLEAWRPQVEAHLDRMETRLDDIDEHLTSQDHAVGETQTMVQQLIDARAAEAAGREKLRGVVTTTAIGGVTTYAVQQALALLAAPHGVQAGGPLLAIGATALAALWAALRPGPGSPRPQH